MKCEHYKFIFIDICKTAGSSINASFMENFPKIKFEGKHHSIPNYTALPAHAVVHSWEGENNHIPNYRMKPMGSTKHAWQPVNGEHYTCSYVTKSDIDNYSLFAVVRNPYDRMVSQYLYGKLRGTYQQCNSFKHFIRNIANNKYGEYNRHRYRTQLNWISDENKKVVVGRILRFEKLQSDFKHLLEELKIPQFKLQKINTAKDCTGQERIHYSYYYDKSKDMVTGLY